MKRHVVGRPRGPAGGSPGRRSGTRRTARRRTPRARSAPTGVTDLVPGLAGADRAGDEGHGPGPCRSRRGGAPQRPPPRALGRSGDGPRRSRRTAPPWRAASPPVVSQAPRGKSHQPPPAESPALTETAENLYPFGQRKGRGALQTHRVEAAVHVHDLPGGGREEVAQQRHHRRGPSARGRSRPSRAAPGPSTTLSSASKPGIAFAASVFSGPAETRLTRMPCGPRSRAR